MRHGFLQDDSHLDAAMSDAAQTDASQLRHLFAAILTHSAPSDPEHMWRTHELALCEDYLIADRKVRSATPPPGWHAALELTVLSPKSYRATIVRVLNQ